MAKFKLNKGNLSDALMGTAMGVAGGIAGKALDKYVLDSMESTTQGIIKAVAGAGLQVLVPNKMVTGISNGLIGAAGYQLADSILPADDEGAPSTAGLPANAAVGHSGGWIANRVYPNAAVPPAPKSGDKSARQLGVGV